MEYKYASKRNFEDFASGRVLFNKAGSTSFPARLASEIFLRCKNHLELKGVTSPYTLFDPCCGGGYLVTTLGFIHINDIRKIIASDISIEAVELAKRNLELLSEHGLNSRIKQLEELYSNYNKESHYEAIISAKKLLDLIKDNSSFERQCFQADIFSFDFNGNLPQIDVVIVDVPYGNIVKWSEDEDGIESRFMDNMRKLLTDTAVLAIVSDKKQRYESTLFKRLERFKIGLRQVSIFEPI